MRYSWIVAFLPLAFLGCSSSDSGSDSNTPSGDGGGGGGKVEAKFASLYSNYFAECKSCHAPSASGRTAETEKTLDFSTAATAYTSLKGKASGLQGNHAGCNDVPFIGSTPDQSLLVAALDQTTRKAFKSASVATCDGDAVGDMGVKVGTPPSAEFMTALKAWIVAGAAND